MQHGANKAIMPATKAAIIDPPKKMLLSNVGHVASMQQMATNPRIHVTIRVLPPPATHLRIRLDDGRAVRQTSFPRFR